MLRTLRACGVSARLLNAMLVIELVSLALVAGLIGLVCGYLIAASLLPDVAASLRGLYGAQIPGRIDAAARMVVRRHRHRHRSARCWLRPQASLKAIRLPVLAAAQPYAWQQAQHRWLILQSALRSPCSPRPAACCGTAIRWYRVCRARGAAARRGAACRRSWTRAPLGQRQARRALAVWFSADSRQQLSGLSLALMALLLALAVNVGVGTMVETFSRTFLTWLDGRLAADVYLIAPDDAQAAEIKAWLRRARRSRRSCERPHRGADRRRPGRDSRPARSRHLSGPLAADCSSGQCSR